MTEIALQPKQDDSLQLIEHGRASWIGVGGGRGCGKSGLVDRVALATSMSQPGLVSCIVMRNFDQVRKYHIEPSIRAFPVLDKFYQVSKSKVRIPVGGTFSEIDFSYAESLADVERRFRSANYKYIFVDQAEQFTDVELLEMKNACRWPGGGAKLVLVFNMGGIGIQFLRKKFHLKEFNENEDPNDYTFIHVYPWDNVEWSRDALASDGLTAADYYEWTDLERFQYFTTRAEYGKVLNALPDALRNRDLLSSWDSLEGAYFAAAYEYKATMVTPTQVRLIQKDWDTRWMSQDWGKSHFCSTHWHSMTTLSPTEIEQCLGWQVGRSLKVVMTYRRSIVSDMTAIQVAQRNVELTPKAEREKLKRFFLSPDAFGDRDSGHTIAERQGQEMRPYEMPFPEQADNERAGGWQLMYDLLANTKAAAKGEPFSDTIWLISSDCPELHEAITLAMRDPKNLDDVLKTDKGQARLEQDVLDDCRYGVKSFLRGTAKPFSVELTERVQSVAQEHGFTQANIEYLKMQQARKKNVRWRRQY